MKNRLLLWATAFYLCCIPAFSQIKINRDGLMLDTRLAPFYHGVASGDPLSDRVIIWTRVTPELDGAVTVKYTMATDTAFKNVEKTGTLTTDASKDYTVKVDVEGLQAGTTYYYYFTALEKNSSIGRTKTVPSGNNLGAQLKFAVVSCNNYEGGFFNAYGRISERNDLDAVIHLGDYIYEYAPGNYRNLGLANNRKGIVPAKEIINEADYRLRYSVYRLDENLQKAHQQHAFISIWDDHEFTNDAYENGAENHTEGLEGVWQARKELAKKVYFEWMPIRNTNTQSIYRKISYGNLLDLFMLDTRVEGRSKPPIHFDDIDVPVRKMISDTQFNWLVNGLATSPAKWKVIGNQVIIANFNVGFAAGSTSTPAAPNPTDIVKIRAIEDLFIDNWKSYPTQRAALLDSIKNKKINNVIFVTGDSHCSWGFDVTKVPTLYPNAASLNIPLPSKGYNRLTGEGSVAVEFATPGISSQNFDEALPLNTALGFQFQMNSALNLSKSGLAKLDTALGLIGDVYYNPHLKYVDLVQQGFMLLDIKEDAAQADWYYVNSKDSSSTTVTTGNATSVAKGAKTMNESNRISLTSTLAATKALLDFPAPKLPLSPTSVEATNDISIAILSMYPNPAKDIVLVNFGVMKSTTVDMEIVNVQGKLCKKITTAKNLSEGNYVQDFSVEDLKSGIYYLKINTAGRAIVRKLVVQ